MRAPSEGGLWIDVLGDSGPFSRFGRSIGYRVRGNRSSYLIDCGAPLFEFLREPEIRAVRGLIGTHSHDDHRRWFTDLALYKKYVAPNRERLRLYTIEAIHEEYLKNSRGALERSLSPDARRVIEVPYEDFIDARVIGPRARLRIRPVPVSGDGVAWRVVDLDGEVVDPATAKVVIHDPVRANRPRLLYKDPGTGEWIEPESFYAFSETVFYEENQNPLIDEESHLEIHPLKAPIWHGPPTVGVEVRTPDEHVIFSSDTVYNPDLWHQLAEEYRPQRLAMGRQAFEAAYVLGGDINHFIERSWSRTRLAAALRAYDRAVVIHDVGEKGSVVHTEYDQIARSACTFHMLTHSPDRFVSEYPLAITGKTYRVLGLSLYEESRGELLELEADLYVRNYPHAYVGFANPKGNYRVVDKGGLVQVLGRDEDSPHPTKFYLDLYRDVGGRYLRELPEGQEYQVRPDGQVERVEYTAEGSRGVLAEDQRAQLAAEKGSRQRGGAVPAAPAPGGGAAPSTTAARAARRTGGTGGTDGTAGRGRARKGAEGGKRRR